MNVLRTPKTLALIALLALLVGAMAPAAIADERGTKDEAVAMVDAAVEHAKKVGAELAFKDFTTDKARWTKKDLYVVVADMKGNMLAHGANPKLVGKNNMEMKDANGVYFTAESVKVAQTRGQGWVDYLWPHPESKKMASKSMYVKKLANYDGWVGVGIYR
jgi:signal transduction histidine kinase